MAVEAMFLPCDDCEDIYLALNTIFLALKSSMVICTIYVHITMAKFSRLFRHKNSQVK